MKKLSLIAGLACLATVGGVFGAWVFGETESQTASVELSLTVDTDIINRTNATVSATTTVAVYFEQDEDKTGYLASDAGVGNEVASVTVTPKTSGETPSYNVSAALTISGGLTTYINSGANLTATKVGETLVWNVTDTNIISAINTADKNAITDAEKATAFIAAVNAGTISVTFTVVEVAPGA